MRGSFAEAEPAIDKASGAEQKAVGQDLAQLTRMRAYFLWEKAGKPHSDESRERFWYQAENDVRASRPVRENA